MKKDRLEDRIAEQIVQYKENYYRLAYSYVRNADDALDIVQESVYKAISSVGALKDPDHINTWLYRIVVNTSLDFLRKRRKVDLLDEEALTGLNLGTVDNYEDFDLRSALDSLPDKYRAVIILRYFEGLKIAEIAEILNENPNTVKTRLYASLQKLRLKLNECKEA